MNDPLTMSIADAEKIWDQVAEKLRPAVLEIAIRKDSGRVEAHFHIGAFKTAKKEATL